MKKLGERIKYYWGITAFQVRLELQRQMEYPSFLVGWLLCNPLQFILGILTIWATVSNFGSLAGWSFSELTFLYGIAVVSHGLSVVLFVQTWYIHYSVIDGEFDRYILRPLNVFFQFSVSLVNLIGITDMFPGICILVYGCIAVNFKPTFMNILMLIVVILCGTFIRGALYIISGSMAFFTKSPNGLTGTMQTMFQYTTMYPMTIYPKIIQNIFTFIIPMGFISFYPVSEFLNKDTGVLALNGMWLWGIGVAAVLMFIAIRFFNYGMTKYESAGS